MKKEKIKQIIDKKEVVSFDIFDTLLFRNIYKPTDLFRIMEREVYDEYGVEDFANLRISCEADSRNEENKNETTLDEIYALMEERVGRPLEKVKKREIEIELEFITYNPFMKEIFDYALATEKKVILISDMYLSSDIVKKLLKKAGYGDVTVYVSCEQHAGKGTTELYELVRKKEGIRKADWVHIGDNRYSDYDKAKEYGIEAILYDNVRSKDTLEEPITIESSIIRGIQNNHLYNGEEVSYWEKFGVLYASPIYYGFTNWLYRLTSKKDNLFFLARDGYIVKKVYDAFKKKDGSKINTYYLYGSRKTFQLPASLYKTKDEIIDFLVSFTDDYNVKMTVKDILDNLGLVKDYSEELKIFGFRDKDDIITRENFFQLRKFLKFIYDDIEVYLREQEKLALAYFKQEGLMKYNKINIMDVGWGGSLQEAMRILTDKEIMGFYFGTIPTKKVDIMSNSLGYVFDEAKPDNYYMDVFNMPMMYEFIFSAPHGTTLCFRKKGKRIEPVLDDDDDEYVKVVDSLQNAAIGVIDTYLQYRKYLLDMTVDDSISIYSNMIARRDYEDLKHFLQLTNSVLYTNAKNSYIEEFDEEYIYQNYDDFKKRIHKAMWRDSYLVKGVNTEQQWDEHKRRYASFAMRDQYNSTKTLDLVKKAIKNPKKAARHLKTMFSK